MKIEVEARPSYGLAVVTLDKGEAIVAESGSMVAMSDKLSVETQFNGVGAGGLIDWLQAAFVGLVRRFLAGETLFVNKFKAKEDGQQVLLAPSLVGDVVVESTRDAPITVQATSYLGSTPNIKVDLIWGGFSMLFGGEGAFFLRCKGDGDVLINAYGAIEKRAIDGKYVVDSGHVVAFEGKLKYKVKRVGGWKSTFLSGEGLVLEFEGQGTLWLQTRNLGAFLGWITPLLPG